MGCAGGSDTPTPLGQLPFSIEFLQVSGRFDLWVESCPLVLTSPNTPSKRDVLGTAMLSILSGHGCVPGRGVRSDLEVIDSGQVGVPVSLRSSAS